MTKAFFSRSLVTLLLVGSTSATFMGFDGPPLRELLRRATFEMERVYDCSDVDDAAMRVVKSKSLLATIQRDDTSGIVTIAVPGSRNFEDWLNNARFFPEEADVLGLSGRVHVGYRDLATELAPHVEDALLPLVDGLKKGSLRVVFLGHSRGGAVAALLGHSLVRKLAIPKEHAGVVLCNTPAFCDRFAKSDLDGNMQIVHLSKFEDIVSGAFSWFYHHAGRMEYYQEKVKSALGYVCDWAPWVLAGTAIAAYGLGDALPYKDIVWSGILLCGLTSFGLHAYVAHRNPSGADIFTFPAT